MVVAMTINKIQNSKTQSLRVLLDRVQFPAWPRDMQLPEIPGFKVERDSFVRPQTSITTYRRVRVLKNHNSNTAIYLQYGAACPWLAPFKVTVVTQRRRGLDATGLGQITEAFERTTLLTAEIAFDFSPSSGVNRKFVLRHGLFGKSKLDSKRTFRDLRYGTRHSATMTRAYHKAETGAYRIEVELHARWLRAHGIRTPGELPNLADLLLPGRLQFVRIDWIALAAHLSRKGLPTESIVSRARSRASCLSGALEYLRDEVRLSNVHRFLEPLTINRPMQRQLSAWAARWECGAPRSDE